jgi:bifunctional non-homologous end joining protein LigD
MLHGDQSIPVTYMAFDVLALDGEPTLRLPYAERRALLEEVTIDGPPSVVGPYLRPATPTVELLI